MDHFVRVRSGAACAHPIPLEFPGELNLVLGLGPLLELVELVQAIRAQHAKANRLPRPCRCEDAGAWACSAGKAAHHNTRHPLRASIPPRSCACPPTHTPLPDPSSNCPAPQLGFAPKPASPLTASAPPSSRARELSRSFLIWSMTILKPRPMPKPTTVKPTDMRTQLEAAVAPSQPRHKL